MHAPLHASRIEDPEAFLDRLEAYDLQHAANCNNADQNYPDWGLESALFDLVVSVHDDRILGGRQADQQDQQMSTVPQASEPLSVGMSEEELQVHDEDEPLSVGMSEEAESRELQCQQQIDAAMHQMDEEAQYDLQHLGEELQVHEEEEIQTACAVGMSEIQMACAVGMSEEAEFVCSSDNEDGEDEHFDNEAMNAEAIGCDNEGMCAEAIDEHFLTMRGDQPKRRRLRHKTVPVVQIPLEPSKKLHHYASARGIPVLGFSRMLRCGLPMALINCLVFLHAVSPRDVSADRPHMADLYAGVANMARAFSEKDLVDQQFDMNRHPIFENILKSEGWLTAIRIIRDTRPGGLASFGTVCSSWIYLCRSKSERSLACPEGNTSVRFVRKANTMVARTSYLVVFAVCLWLVILHEQPWTSIMSASKYFVWMRNIIRMVLHEEWEEAFVWLGSYGHDLLKPTQLMGNRQWIHGLKRPLTDELRARCESSDAVQHLQDDPTTMRRRVTGKPSGLKSSQAYPIEYCRSVQQLWSEQNEVDVSRGIDDSDIDIDDEDAPWEAWRAASAACDWPEAHTDRLCRFLNIPSDRPL